MAAPSDITATPTAHKLRALAHGNLFCSHRFLLPGKADAMTMMETRVELSHSGAELVARRASEVTRLKYIPVRTPGMSVFG
jgi:hypothetical protein